MTIAALMLSALALGATVDAGVSLPPQQLVLAQEGDAPPPPPPPPVEEGEDFAEPPPPAPEPEPVVTPEPPEPPAASESPAGPRAEQKRRPKKEEGLDPLLVRGAQIGAGVGTCAACGVGVVGLSCLLLPLTVPLAAIPFASTVVNGLISVVLCGGMGAVVGGVETGVGNLLGEEEVGYLWPIAAGAGVGAGYSVIALALGLVSAVINLTDPPPPIDPNAPPSLNQVFATTNPITLTLGFVSLGLCTAACVAMPIVPALVYGMMAEPQDGSVDASSRDLHSPPPSRVASAMAF